MNKIAQAEEVRKKLLAQRPAIRAKVLRKTGEKLNMNNHPDAKIATACVDGLGPKGIRELLVAVSLWLIENDITEQPPVPKRS